MRWQDGLGDRPTILYAKAALDGVAAIALTSTLGIGVIFSVIPLLLYQGGITLVADLASAVLTEPVISEMNAVGGLLIVAIACDLLGFKRLPVGNLLPGSSGRRCFALELRPCLNCRVAARIGHFADHLL